LIQAWHSAAPLLFGEVFDCFKKGFETKQITALISLSHNRGASLSFRSLRFMLLGLRGFLEKSNDGISDEEHFAAFVFHELLHMWLFENMLKDKSALLEKYKFEHSHVLSHIHLMAIQKFVYLNLGCHDMVAMLSELYSKSSFHSAYKRAWEIVNDIEGYEVVIQDIHASLT